ncbi:hypothetical protein F5Y09DRAFT_352534 [Xylaria sp. FL1042]|nr:hypothetical protein F5Y09DRAFT_352534 [Xylaria sp. FL1042]
MSPRSQSFYYDTIKDESTLARVSERSPSLQDLLRSDWKSAASQWGRKQLLAHRVVCSKPTPELPLLSGLFPDLASVHDCVAKLIEGPQSLSAIKNNSEPQIVRRYQPDSLAYVWAALVPFLRGIAEPDRLAVDMPSTPPRKRERKAPDRYECGVPSAQINIGSSPDSKQRPATAESHSTFSSVGYYMEMPEAPLLEDSVVRLASCFVRCVLNYAQPADDPRPFLEFLFITESDDPLQVVLLEGKRTFQKVVDGEAVITDELLGQMVGKPTQDISSADFVIIHTTTYYIKFFHFHAPETYTESYNSTSYSDPRDISLEGLL